MARWSPISHSWPAKAFKGDRHFTVQGQSWDSLAPDPCGTSLDLCVDIPDIIFGIRGQVISPNHESDIGANL